MTLTPRRRGRRRSSDPLVMQFFRASSADAAAVRDIVAVYGIPFSEVVRLMVRDALASGWTPTAALERLRRTP